MPTVSFSRALPASAQQAYDWHAHPGAFARLTPPWQPVRLLHHDGGVHTGVRARIALGYPPFTLTWEALHTEHRPGRLFVDEAVRGPFRSWRHAHHFDPAGSQCVLRDEITWSLPGGGLFDPLAKPLVHHLLSQMFGFRQERTAMDLQRHAQVGLSPKRIAVSGASGLLGQALTAFLQSGGHTVLPLVRGNRPTPNGIAWSPARGEIDAAALEGVDAVVHLAGAGIADGRWTEARKQEIRSSRVAGTSLLARTLAGLTRPPQVFVSASATGFYGANTPGVLDETSPAGEDFLAQVCVDWEAAADAARDAGIRVVHPRTGIVLTANGGALGQMLPAFRAGAGGRIGSGQQPMSWVSEDDWLGAILQMIAHPTLQGAVNVVAPAPVDNATFVRTLARVLGRPAFLPLPAFAVRAMFGEMGDALLLSGTHVVPRALQHDGFVWQHATLEGALRMTLGKLPPPASP